MEGSIVIAEATGKTIREMMVYEGFPTGREVCLKFTDDTEMIVEVEMKISTVVEHYRTGPGNAEILAEYREPSQNRPAPRRSDSRKVVEIQDHAQSDASQTD